jgi:hypothetical protein
VFPLAKTELSVILAAEAYGLAGLVAFTVWRFARHRWAVAPAVLSLFSVFVSIDYALTEDRFAGRWFGVALAVYAATAWACFRFSPPLTSGAAAGAELEFGTVDSSTPPAHEAGPATNGLARPDSSPGQAPTGTTTDQLATTRSQARQVIGALTLVNIVVVAAAVVARARAS